jgi:hypothetical protein
MGPDSSEDPTIETVEELSDMGSFVILSPTPQERIKFRNQFPGLQGERPLGSLPHLIHETSDGLLLGVRIQRTLSGLTTNPALGKMHLPLPALDFVAQELEALLDMSDPRLLRM